MLVKTLGTNAEFVRQFAASDKIKRVAVPNLRRQAGLIVNHSSSKVWIEYGDYPVRLLADPTRSIIVPPHGGNTDMPADYVGAIWAMWADPTATGWLNLHHYYNLKS